MNKRQYILNKIDKLESAIQFNKEEIFQINDILRSDFSNGRTLYSSLKIQVQRLTDKNKRLAKLINVLHCELEA